MPASQAPRWVPQPAAPRADAPAAAPWHGGPEDGVWQEYGVGKGRDYRDGGRGPQERDTVCACVCAGPFRLGFESSGGGARPPPSPHTTSTVLTRGCPTMRAACGVRCARLLMCGLLAAMRFGWGSHLRNAGISNI